MSSAVESSRGIRPHPTSPHRFALSLWRRDGWPMALRRCGSAVGRQVRDERAVAQFFSPGLFACLVSVADECERGAH